MSSILNVFKSCFGYTDQTSSPPQSSPFSRSNSLERGEATRPAAAPSDNENAKIAKNTSGNRPSHRDLMNLPSRLKRTPSTQTFDSVSTAVEPPSQNRLSRTDSLSSLASATTLVENGEHNSKDVKSKKFEKQEDPLNEDTTHAEEAVFKISVTNVDRTVAMWKDTLVNADLPRSLGRWAIPVQPGELGQIQGQLNKFLDEIKSVPSVNKKLKEIGQDITIFNPDNANGKTPIQDLRIRFGEEPPNTKGATKQVAMGAHGVSYGSFCTIYAKTIKLENEEKCNIILHEQFGAWTLVMATSDAYKKAKQID